MSPKYFNCEPWKLCEGTACCRIPETKPNLTLGDYLRLSQLTGKDITEIWTENGDVLLLNPEDDDQRYDLFLSLIHDPCPYLLTDKCEVHDAKPISCVAFPIHEYICGDDRFTDQTQERYPCLKDVKPKPGQTKLGRQSIEIMLAENRIDDIVLWEGKRPHLNISSIRDYRGLINEAMLKQDKRDPGREHIRTQRLISTTRKMEEIRARGETIDTNEMGEFLSPATFILFGDMVTQKMEELMNNEGALKAYNETTERWRQISGKFD
jgi:Fe-S-cluster containining protein